MMTAKRQADVWFDHVTSVFRLRCARCGVEATYGVTLGNLAVRVAQGHECFGR